MHHEEGCFRMRLSLHERVEASILFPNFVSCCRVSLVNTLIIRDSSRYEGWPESNGPLCPLLQRNALALPLWLAAFSCP